MADDPRAGSPADSPAGPPAGGYSRRTMDMLAALLAIDATTAEQVRLRSPGRHRHRGRSGPLLDLGDESVDENEEG